MDSRFKNIDNELKFKIDQSQIDNFFNEFDEIALDNAFREASQKMAYPYAPQFWNQFSQAEPELIETVYFSESAKNYSSAYNPIFWNAAEEALAQEGLNHQYKSTYWDEAEKLLVAADRKVFFRKWLTIASSILLIGIASQTLLTNQITKFTPESKFSENTAIQNASKADKSQTPNKFKAITEQGNNIVAIKSEKNTSQTSSEQVSNDQSKKNITSDNSHTVDNNKNELKPKTIQKVKLGNIQGKRKTSNSTIASVKKPVTSAVYIESKDTEINYEHEGSQDQNVNFYRDFELSKIHLTSPILLAQSINKPLRGEMKLIEVIKQSHSSKPQLYVAAQTGIGNSMTNSFENNLRTSLDLGLTFNGKRFNNFNFTVLTGFDHQSLKGYVDRHDVSNYRRNGKIDKLMHAYEFKDVIKWQNSILVGYKISRKLHAKLGVGIDYYFTSKIQMMEQLSDEINIADFDWGRNDFINANDIQIISQLEYVLKNKLSIIATGEFGLRNQINTIQNPLMMPSRNISVQAGIKYRLF